MKLLFIKASPLLFLCLYITNYLLNLLLSFLCNQFIIVFFWRKFRNSIKWCVFYFWYRWSFVIYLGLYLLWILLLWQLILIYMLLLILLSIHQNFVGILIYLRSEWILFIFCCCLKIFNLWFRFLSDANWNILVLTVN